jgi:hypothetical protein
VKYFIDTEFIESGPHKPIDLISIGIVREDRQSLYCVSAEFRDEDASDWVKENVLPHILGVPRYSLQSIKEEIVKFVGKDIPEFWGYYADYDWVVFAQIFGAMVNLPKGWPMYCNDLKQRAVELSNPKLPEQESTEHNALEDAQWNLASWEFLERQIP